MLKLCKTCSDYIPSPIIVILPKPLQSTNTSRYDKLQRIPEVSGEGSCRSLHKVLIRHQGCQNESCQQAHLHTLLETT